MNMMRSSLALALILLTSSVAIIAEEHTPPDTHQADRQQLRKLLVDIEAAINANQVEKLLPYLDDNVVITHQNAHVVKGKDEVISYNKLMTQGSDAPIKKLTTKATIGGPAYFHGDNVAIGYGTAVDQVELASGQTFSLQVAWSTTLVKKAGVWKAASIHFSTNVMDNAVLRQLKKMLWWVGGGSLVLGLLIGGFIGSRKRKSNR